MLRAIPMMHLRVQVPNRDAPAVTRCVAREGLLHLVDLAHGRIPGMGPPAQAHELLAAFRDLERRIRQMSERIGSPLPELVGNLGSGDSPEFAEDRERIEQELRPLERGIEASYRALIAARERAAAAREALAHASLLARAAVDAGRLSKVRYVEVRLLLAREEELTPLAALLDPAPFALLPLQREADRWLCAAALPAGSAERLDQALRATTCERVPLPQGAREPAALERERRDAESDERRALEALAGQKTRAVPILTRLLPRAETNAVLLQAETLFAASGRFTVLSGWVPATHAERLRAAVQLASGGRAVIDVERPEDMPEAARQALRVPILHRNPLLLRPFEGLVSIYGTPSYEELEPTAFLAVSFLLMFGLMFGDLGHGAVLFCAGLLLFRRVPRFLDYGILLMEAGVASMLFGILYGSVFGIERLLPALWLRPIEDLPRFMTIAVTLGIGLVSIGLLLNVVNLWRSGQRAGALFGARGLFGAFLYWVLLVLLARAFVPRTWILSTSMLVVLSAVPVLLLVLRPTVVKRLEHGRRRPHAPGTPAWLGALEGSVELVDTLFSFFANTVSFVRIAAFAAVHAGVSIALFALADTLSRVRFGGALSILALVLGNALAILLEGLTVSVQVLRLEYYEFFTKFFRGGGEPYRPLMLRPTIKEGSS